VIISAICGVGSLVLLLRNADRGARVLAIGAVASVVVAWGVGQWPYLLPTSLKVSQGAAPDGTLQAVILVFVLAAVIILPSLALLYNLDQKGLLPEEGVDAPNAGAA
jgi:cytochrome d ubiquinol oxidase subunit II